MTNVREAVGIAFRFADEVLAQQKLVEPRLEEVEASQDGELWHVTISFVREPAKLAEMLEPMIREYKVVTVRAQDGQVQSMKIRQPA